MKTKPEYELEKYEHELSTLEHVRDYVQMKIDIVTDKIKECRHVLEKLGGGDEKK